MIVGGGIIAKSMYGVSNQGATIFASGVSNSLCTETYEFIRERELLLKQDTSKKMIYFSTCSLSDGTEHNHYLKHKLHMEELVSETFDDWLVLRLPTVVGRGGNPNNFFNFITQSLRNGDDLHVQRNLRRSLLDCDDILTLCTTIIDKVSHETIDVCVENSQSALEIVLQMKEAISSTSKVFELSDKTNHVINNERLRDLNRDGFELLNVPDYNQRLIKKYLKL